MARTVATFALAALLLVAGATGRSLTATVAGPAKLSTTSSETDFERNVQWWQANLAAWGSGRFDASNPNRAEELLQFWADDMVVDARYPLANDAAGVFTRHEGIDDFLAFLDGITVSDRQNLMLLCFLTLAGRGSRCRW